MLAPTDSSRSVHLTRCIQWLATLCMFILVLAVSACNKEKDEPDTRTALQEVSITLHFNTDYNDSTEYDSRSRSAQGMRSRYTIYAYETTQTGRSTVRATDVPTYTYSKVLDKASYDNFTTTIELSPGKWELFVWYDNIDTESGYTYYDCSNVFSISVNTTDVYRGNDNYREAFCGSADISIDDNPESINITMQRPLAKIEFISNDLDQFIESQGENIDLGRYTVRFYYTGYLPTMFNMLTDRPSDSSSNIYFDGSIERISNKEAVIGFDHVFVSEQGSSVPVIVAVYDKNGNQITVSPTYNVALVRNGITIVTGKFLSSSSGYGPVINAEYTGTYNIVF